MPALSDQLLASGCAAQIAAIHGETVTLLDGPLAGRTLIAVREVQADQELVTELGIDPRAKIFLRFRDDPQLGDQGKVTTDDGRKWNAVRRQESQFLTNDYELTEVVAGVDQT